MLELKRISWRNFLSYGDYVTTLELAGRGQCLITGVVTDDDAREVYDNTMPFTQRRSNGAGKSAIPAAIQWALFGRTMHSANPGNSVINWFTNKDCWVRLEFKNGDSITRIRSTSNRTELIYVRDGNEDRLTADTLSTARAQQAKLNRIFGLDWEIFSCSTFFNQYGHPWMEMTDQGRKKVLERLLRVDRFIYYSRVAKTKCDKLEMAQERANDRKRALELELQRLAGEAARLTESSNNFAQQLRQRRQQALDAAAQQIRLRDEIELPDLEKLKAKWAVVHEIENKISQYQREINDLTQRMVRHEASAQAARHKIDLWQQMEGKVCTACEQTISSEHVASRIGPIRSVAAREAEAALAIRLQQQQLQDKIAAVEALLAHKRPKLTVHDALNLHARWQQHDQEARRLQQTADAILSEPNPYEAAIATIHKRMDECRAEIDRVQQEAQQQSYLSRHYNYVYRAYQDRNKIKSFIFREHVRFINSRLNHYLDAFGLDVRIELTDSLGIASNMWDYHFESGGERKRTDIAFMLATFDFHEHMYGRQSNVLVLDEVDGRLDDDGIESLINIIKNDIAPRVETILIISHRNQMHNVYPTELRVRRTGRLSYLETV